MKNICDLRDSFLKDCGARNLSSHTTRAYKHDLQEFVEWVKHTGSEVLPLKRTQIVGWVEHLQECGFSAATVKRRLASLKVFVRWMELTDEIQENPFHKLNLTVRLPKRLPRNLSHDETRLLITAGIADAGHLRDQTTALALELLYATGMRVGELCSIQLADIDRAAGKITICGKGNRERRVFIEDKSVRLLLDAYLERRKKLLADHTRLLITPRGTPASTDYIRRNLHRLARERKLTRKVTPHMLRHTAATQLIEAGIDIRFVQKLLGHSSISTTEIYTHVSDVHLQKAIARADIRRRLHKR